MKSGYVFPHVSEFVCVSTLSLESFVLYSLLFCFYLLKELQALTSNVKIYLGKKTIFINDVALMLTYKQNVLQWLSPSGIKLTHTDYLFYQNMVHEGYAATQILCQLHESIIEQELSDRQKSAITEKMAVSNFC